MRSLPLVLSLVVSAFLVGCRAHGTSVQGPGMTAKREANLLELASRDLQCPTTSLSAAFVESVERNAHIYRVTGCEKTFDAALVCPLGSCIWYETPERRAAFDLQCPREQLTRTYLGNSAFGMAGCGRTITYLLRNGGFVANSSTIAVPTASPAAP